MRVLLVALLLVPSGAAAQTMLWAGYGQNTDQATGVDTGENLTAGLARFGSWTGFAASLGLPVDPDTSMRWGTVGGWFDRPGEVSPWGVAGSANIFIFGDPVLDRTGGGSMATLDGYRVVDLAQAELRLRVGARHGTDLGGAPDEDGSRGFSQRLLGRVGTDLGVLTDAFSVRAEVDHWRAEEGGYTQVGARASLVDPRMQAWAGINRWLDDALPGTGWEVGARVPVVGRVAVMARGGVQAPDILFQVPPQRTWSVAIQVLLGAVPPLARVPGPAVHDARQPVTLTLPVDAVPGDPAVALPPSVAGTFSGWQPVPMRMEGDRWEAELVLQPGVHEYSFVTAGGEWFIPAGTPGRKPDGFGGHAAVLIVQ
jgi:hypothetical protein